MFWLFAFLLLAAAFGVLVWTFVWVSRLLAERARVEQGRAAAAGEPGTDAAEAPPDEPTTEEIERQEEEKERLGTGVNATLGLILGILSCVIFWLSPLTMAVSVAGTYFSANALWLGLRRFHVLIGRAAIGIVLSLASFGLHFAYLTNSLGRLIAP